MSDSTAPVAKDEEAAAPTSEAPYTTDAVMAPAAAAPEVAAPEAAETQAAAPEAAVPEAVVPEAAVPEAAAPATDDLTSSGATNSAPANSEPATVDAAAGTLNLEQSVAWAEGLAASVFSLLDVDQSSTVSITELIAMMKNDEGDPTAVRIDRTSCHRRPSSPWCHSQPHIHPHARRHARYHTHPPGLT